MKRSALGFMLLALTLLLPFGVAQDVYKGHAISLNGDIKYPADFTHFEYVNPDAPKGGEIVLGAIGNYDSFNGFIAEGATPAGLGLIYDSLVVGSQDEPFTEYGSLAESIEVPADKSYVQFVLREGAKWHDGVAITADDVVFTYEKLITEGDPFYQQYYESVADAEKIDDRTVRFNFSGETNNELPLIMGQIQILPKHYWEDKDFGSVTTEPPLGSGPYKIKEFDMGRGITYERVTDYWAKDLPINVGQNNFDTIRYDYYQDTTVSLEAFKAGKIDFRAENRAKNFATEFNIPAKDQGHLIVETLSHNRGTGMQGFVFNTRLPKFQDPKVRQALAYAFDFEWSNANLFYGQYTRTTSYFSNTELASSGLPEGKELEILETYRGQIPEEVFTSEFTVPVTDGSGNLREGLATAQGLLEEAGWTVQDGKLKNATGEVMDFEVLLFSPAFEPIVAPFVQNLERLGITATLNTLQDSSQIVERGRTFDFEMIITTFGQSLSPGNEQRNYWSSEAADTEGSRNYVGIKNPVVDELIETLIASPDRESLVAATHALDRVLLWNHYVIPNWYVPNDRVVYWNMFGRPEVVPIYGANGGFGASGGTWWMDAEKAATLVKGQ
jgi:microcin C transport system substrate-binding protein